MTENNNKRKQTRIGNDMPISFSLSVLDFMDLKPIEANGIMLDRSETGMGFLTDFSLEPGHVIRIKGADNTFATAVVKWTSEIEGQYRVGVLIYK